jgi:hypothetical protein
MSYSSKKIVTQKLNGYKDLADNNLENSLISQEEFDVLLEEIDYMNSKLSNPN